MKILLRIVIILTAVLLVVGVTMALVNSSALVQQDGASLPASNDRVRPDGGGTRPEGQEQDGLNVGMSLLALLKGSVIVAVIVVVTTGVERLLGRKRPRLQRLA